MGTSGTAQTFLPQTIHPFVVGALRLSIGGFILLAILLLLKKISFKNWSWKYTIFAALSIALSQYFYFHSMRLTGVAISAVVAISSAPVFSGIVEWLVQKKRPSKVWIISTIFAFFGSSLLLLHGEGVTLDARGVFMALGAGISFAIYTLFNKEVLKTTSAIPAVAVIFSISGFITVPFIFLFETEGVLTRAGILTSLYLGIVTVGVAYSLFMTGLRSIPSSSALTLQLAEPLVAMLLAVVIIGERLEMISWIGIVFLISGIFILTFGRRRESPI